MTDDARSTACDSTVRAILARFDLTDAQQRRLGAILALLADDEHAPTPARARDDAVRTHVADSLVGLEIDELRAARTIADIGTGAGFPGLALAVALPEADVRLVESQARKCDFVRRAASAGGLDNATVVCARAELWDEGTGANDVIVARALGPQPVVLEYAAPLLRTGGTVVDWRGRRSDADERTGAAAAATLGLARVAIRHVRPFEGATDRYLHVFAKERETPARFPRRPGIARKRPLCAL
jgi:16S rRNA (guanine527-N7)-methyltransferase